MKVKTKTNSLGTLIERLELIAQDTRKEFEYDKSTGLWAWLDRNREYDKHGGFKTRLAALMDAVEPYTDEDL